MTPMFMKCYLESEKRQRKDLWIMNPNKLTAVEFLVPTFTFDELFISVTLVLARETRQKSGNLSYFHVIFHLFRETNLARTSLYDVLACDPACPGQGQTLNAENVKRLTSRPNTSSGEVLGGPRPQDHCLQRRPSPRRRLLTPVLTMFFTITTAVTITRTVQLVLVRAIGTSKYSYSNSDQVLGGPRLSR